MTVNADIPTSPSGREGPDHGPTVDPVTREVRRTSVSALQMADDSTNEGCLRKWFFDKVLKFREESTAAQLVGVEHHALTAGYLTTGEKRLPDRILRNLHFVEPPSADLMVEHSTIPEMSDGSSGLAFAPLRADGIPVVGFIDLVHGRRTNRGGSDVTDTLDPEGTIEIVDWKFTGSMDYAKQGRDLIKTIQMVGYGKYRFDVGWPGDLVRLSHGYMPARGRGEKRTMRTDRNTIEKAWEHANSVARSLRDVARAATAEEVPGNPRACRAFRKLCMHAMDGRCSVGRFNSLRNIVNANPRGTEMPVTISILDRLRSQPAPAPSVTIGLAPTPTGPTPEETAVRLAAEKAAEVARLHVEEQEQREARAFDTILGEVLAFGHGGPTFAGAALAIATRARPGYAASGALAALVVEDVTVMTQLRDELRAGALAEAERLADTTPPALLSLETPEAIPPTPPAVVPMTPAAPSTSPAPVASTEDAAPAKPRRGRPPKTQPVVSAETPRTADGTFGDGAPKDDRVDALVPSVATAMTARIADPAVNLFVDVSVDGANVHSLHDQVDLWCTTLANMHEAADIRCAPDRTPLAFGKWPGALIAYIRSEVSLDSGNWYLDSRGGQVIETVIEALRPMIKCSGGMIVRGQR